MTWNVYPQIKSLYVHVRGLFADSTKKNTSSHIWSSYCGKAIKSNQRLQLRLLKVMVELPPGNPVQSTSVDQGMFYTAHGFTYAMLGQVAWKPSASVPNDPDMNGLAGGHCSERFFTFQSCRSIAHCHTIPTLIHTDFETLRLWLRMHQRHSQPVSDRWVSELL